MPLSRRQKKQLAKAAAADARPLPGSGDKLVNDLTVGDARHMLRAEGGPLTPGLIASRLANIVLIQGTVAWAIIAGGATVWHLLLAMVAQYLGILVSAILCYFWWRPKDLWKDVRGAFVLFGILAFAFAVTTFVRSVQGHTQWDAQASLDARAMFDWVIDHKMQWPMLAGFILSMIETRRRVLDLIKHGPPFIGTSLGCAMRLVVVLLGCVLIPVIAANWSEGLAVWLVWAIVLIAEFLGLWMHWDMQVRLEKLDGEVDEEKPSLSEVTEDTHPLKF